MAQVQKPEPVAGKRTPLGKLKLNTNTITKGRDDGQLSAAEKRQALEKLQLEVNERCKALRQLTEDKVDELRNELQLQIMKLPKKIRNMPYAEFRDKFQLDVNLVMLSGASKRIAATPAALRTTSKSRTRGGTAPAEAQTVRTTRRKRKCADVRVWPAPLRFAADDEQEQADIPKTTVRKSARQRTVAQGGSAATLQTPAPSGRRSARQQALYTPGGQTLRVPRAGEVLLSENGSPLGTFMDGGVTPMVGTSNSLKTPATRGTAKKRSKVKAVATIKSVMKPGISTITEEDEVDLEDASIQLRTETGATIDLSEDTNPAELSQDLKTAAMSKLQQMQKQVLAIMNRLRG
eukprot:scaffold2261_cov405-Prasinococcus_capsulatus_cf.AAC.2